MTGLAHREADPSKKKKKKCCSFIASAQTTALFLFPELRVLELLVLLEHFQHYSGQIRRNEEEDKNF